MITFDREFGEYLDGGWLETPETSEAPAPIEPDHALPRACLPDDDAIAALLHRTGQGETEAFTALYRTCVPSMFGTALALLKDRGQAEEAVQEAFLRIWQRAGSYRPERGAPMAWLRAIVRHRALDMIRQRRAIEVPFDEDFDRRPNADVSSSTDLLAHTDMSIVLRGVVAQLDAMPRRMRECVLMSCYEGYTNSEIAERLGAPLGSVKCWIRRGLMRLKGAPDLGGAPLFACA